VHLRGPRCTSVGQDPYCDQIDKDKLKSIEKRFRGTSPPDAWKSIHQILFPDDDVSDLSPYMDDQRDVQPVTHFVNLFKSYPAIARYLQSELARNNDSKTPLPEETRSILGKALDIVASPGQEDDYITVGPRVCPFTANASISADASGDDSSNNVYYQQARCIELGGVGLSSVAKGKQPETQEEQVAWSGGIIDPDKGEQHDMATFQQELNSLATHRPGLSMGGCLQGYHTVGHPPQADGAVISVLEQYYVPQTDASYPDQSSKTTAIHNPPMPQGTFTTVKPIPGPRPEQLPSFVPRTQLNSTVLEQNRLSVSHEEQTNQAISEKFHGMITSKRTAQPNQPPFYPSPDRATPIPKSNYAYQPLRADPSSWEAALNGLAQTDAYLHDAQLSGTQLFPLQPVTSCPLDEWINW